MFTGIIEDTGTLTALEQRSQAARMVVDSALPWSQSALGDSVAVDGVCLTITSIDGRRVAFDLGPETLAVTSLGRKRTGDPLHLERALRLSDRLGGHLLLGHVDEVGTVAHTERRGDALIVRVRATPKVLDLCIDKGSIAMNGVSLTLNALLPDGAHFEVGLIPHTLARTHLGALRVGDPVNLESDVLGKYVARLLGQRGRTTAGGVDTALLESAGFLRR